MEIQQLTNWTHFDKQNSERPIKFLVIHNFAYPVKKVLEIWAEMDISPHYLIDTKGKILQLVPEDKIAWHAGKSFWRGKNSLNASSIGIELHSPSFGQSPYPKPQIRSFIELATDIIKRYHIKPENILGHSDCSCDRKIDPGITFPWAEMAKYGIGIWPSAQTKARARGCVSSMLKRIGYDTTNEKAALLAFMRHFMPDQINKDDDIFKMEELLTEHIKNLKTPDAAVIKRLRLVASAYPSLRPLLAIGSTTNKCSVSNKKRKL